MKILLDYMDTKYDKPSCMKSRTDYMITVANYPMIWQSKLQISMINAEIATLAHRCHELCLILDMVALLGVTMSTSLHKDNAVPLVLAEKLPPKYIARSKCYQLKMIWFCEQLKLVNMICSQRS